LAAGEEGTRAQVPWSQVGAGWTLATWKPSAVAGPPSDQNTVFLVDAQGGRYNMGTTTAPLVDWSGDGRRALFALSAGAGNSEQATVEDLITGQRQSFVIANAFDSIRFSRPTGQAVMSGGANLRTGAIPMDRFGLDGQVQLSYPTSYPGAG